MATVQAFAGRPGLGRDRDPFDRTLAALRARLLAPPPLQGAALPINGLAADLAVSPTPVREALARLSGEGLIDRTATGYAGLVHSPQSLADLYRLARTLAVTLIAGAADRPPPIRRSGAAPGQPSCEVAVRAGDAGVAAQEPGGPVANLHLWLSGAGVGVAQAYGQVRAQLAPFAAAEVQALGAVVPEEQRLVDLLRQGGGTRLSPAVRAYYDRRIRAAGSILAVALSGHRPGRARL